jgi:hypothetical protein
LGAIKRNLSPFVLKVDDLAVGVFKETPPPFRLGLDSLAALSMIAGADAFCKKDWTFLEDDETLKGSLRMSFNKSLPCLQNLLHFDTFLSNQG